MWEINAYNQTISFVLSLCLGAVFCVLYDMIRAIRRVCLNSFLAVLFTDILIWLFYAFATFIFLMARTNGEIRGFILMGELLGFILCRISLSRLFCPILCFIFTKAAAIKQRISAFIGRFYIKFETFGLKLWQGLSKIFKSLKKLLKNTVKLLYTDKNIASTEKTINETKTKA